METTQNINNAPEKIIPPAPEPEKIAPFIENSNKNLWDRISGGAKEIMSNTYEGIYLTPGLNKVVGKMEIAYNQFWIDKKEGKAARLKDKMDAIGTRNSALENAQSEISKTAEMLQKAGLPGSASNLFGSKKIENQISKNENKMDKLQGRIEKRENRINLFTNKRDAIADRLITHYEKKLSPLEGKLEVLEERRNEIELFCISSEVKLDEQKAKIKKIEEARSKIESAYLKAGFSDRQIKKDLALKELNNQINNIYTSVQLEKSKIATRRKEINEKIAKVNKKAEPYRNKKNKFVRIKDSRPVDFQLKERDYPNEWNGSEETKGHSRQSRESTYREQEYNNETENSEEVLYSGMERFDDLTEKWNKLVVENSEYLATNENGTMVPDSEYLKINPEEIMRATRISAYNQMSLDNFTKIVEQYYKVKKIEKNMYQKIINKFIQ